jgi:hypothetical protein
LKSSGLELGFGCPVGGGGGFCAGGFAPEPAGGLALAAEGAGADDTESTGDAAATGVSDVIVVAGWPRSTMPVPGVVVAIAAAEGSTEAAGGAPPVCAPCATK